MKKIYKKIRNKYRKLRLNFLENYQKIERKIKYPILYKLGVIPRKLELLLTILILGTILQLFGFININFIKNILRYIPKVHEDLNRQIVFSQLSVTFLILSLFSLITNLKKEKLLGTSIYRIAFANSILGNIITVSLILFILLATNIAMYLSDNRSTIILPLFLIILLILMLMISKIILYTNSRRLSRNKILSIYYWENKKIFSNSLKISRNPTYQLSEYIYDLNEDTLEKILRKDVEYRRNAKVYEIISNLSLKNYKKKIQENYTETIKAPDIITFWSNCIEEFIRNELYFDALHQYNTMLRIFISNEVYISSHSINKLLEKIFIGISSTKNKMLFEQNKELLLKAIEFTMHYCYFQLNNDFSYTRIGKLKWLYLSPLYGNFLIDYYNLIDKSLSLDDNEKSKQLFEYFESLRMISFDVSKPFHENLRMVKYNVIEYDLIKYDGDLCLVGIPLSKLMIHLIQENNRRSLLYFLKDFNNNSIYFSCLIVGSKLISLYLESNEDDKNTISDYLILLIAKLIEWDNFKIKYNCFILKQFQNENMNCLYSWFFFENNDIESLNIVKQLVMIKKIGINTENISSTNIKLKKMIPLLSEINYETLTIARKEEFEKTNDKFSVFKRLI
ncbi:hypothetical protein CN692_10870 [Bacillus sp. AFS002410]|uniref:hypothetical protein n=1 Tax=Bacillus sp. AFS002410 TaxID=2033481 RepID=UPI000BF176C3|nr:hypothetical protein [Bacillus sp. AFS002410]PEJ57984.1 hypothetical protein CN692_10870 [Bacillus sp. AFS002410]